jgi:hypothetical protein
MIQCHNCFSAYSKQEFDYLYCSLKCKEEDELRLKEGNSLLEKAEKENPQIFSQTITSEDAQALLNSILNLKKGNNNV